MFLGAGSSSAVPLARCLMDPESDCPVCNSSRWLAPEENPNYRGNPSLVLRHYYNGRDRPTFVQIDAGKTFRENAVRWFPRLGIPRIDGVVITHGHMDAFGGLDDLRGLQYRNSPVLPIFLCSDTFSTVRRAFPYLVPEAAKGVDDGGIKRLVARLEYQVFERLQTFSAPGGLPITPFGVPHGGSFICNAFLVGGTLQDHTRARRALCSSGESLAEARGELRAGESTELLPEAEAGAQDAVPMKRIAYMSDISSVPEEVKVLLRAFDPEIVILDGLNPDVHNSAHMSVRESTEVAVDMRFPQTYIVGMSCRVDYHEVSKELNAISEKEGIRICLARDGLAVSVAQEVAEGTRAMREEC